MRLQGRGDMDGEKMQDKIEELEQQIAALPVGYISKKKIHGKCWGF